LGLTATPDRADGDSILEDFRNMAHKLDLKEAVELGEACTHKVYSSEDQCRSLHGTNQWH